jgi:hypothetical protein
LTWLQHFVFVHVVQAESLEVGVQRMPPEEDEAPLHGPAQAAATHALRAWVVASGRGHWPRQ